MRKSGKSIQNKGRKGESGYIYFIISDGNEKKKIYFKQGRWKLEEKKKEDKEDSSKRLHGWKLNQVLLFEEMEENKKVVGLGK